MYESFFALRQRPFSAAPLVSRYVPVAGLEQARRTISRCIERAEGPALVIGPAGCGKTLLCYLLADEFAQQLQPVLLFSGHLSTRRDLLQAILFELGLPYRGLEEGELRLALIDHLTRSTQCPGGILLIVDEAHALPVKLLEELRMITNIVRGGQPRVRMALIGGPALEERLASPKLDSFSQRLAARCYLEPLDRSETFDYVRAQIHMAGGDSLHVFAHDALDAVFKASDGIPRLINQTCDHALLSAAQAKQRPVDGATIERAWANLQQLPSPWTETPADRTRGSIVGESIEFGDLDEDEPLFTPAGPSFTTAEDVPQTNFAPTLGEEMVISTDCGGCDIESLQILCDELRHWDAGATEVELVIDDVATEPNELFEINLSLTGTAAAPAHPQWHSTEFCEAPDEIGETSKSEAYIAYAPEEAAELATAEETTIEQEVSEQEVVEEVVVDRYARLDALKRQGKLPSPLHAAAEPVQAAVCEERPTGISVALEKSLTLAEALVQHAAALEANAQEALSVHTSEVVAGEVADVWTSAIALPPSGEASESVECQLEELTADLQPIENCQELPAPCVLAASADEEPDLIVIEDDPPALAIAAQPQATPIKKQEYRQLFARLRRS